MNRLYFLGLALAFLLISLAAPADELPDPEKPGPYPVGVTTKLFIDASRTDTVTGQPRALMTDIWYPATEETRDLPKNQLIDFFAKGTNKTLAGVLKLAFDVDLAEVNARFKNFAVRDARVRDGGYPLVLFSHGNGGLRMQNAFWCEHLASHGYIVASPDHTGNAAFTIIDGRMIPFKDTDDGRKQSAEDRPKDIRFLINAMERANLGADSRFLGKIDLEHIAVAGHSFGGMTTSWVAEQDDRVDAAIPMAGASKDPKSTFSCPVLLFMATEDDTLGPEFNALLREYPARCTGPAYFVEFKNGGHFTFTEMYQFVPDFGDGAGSGKRIESGEPLEYVPMTVAGPLINGYSTAFLGKFLKGQDGYDAYLVENHNPDELIVKTKTYSDSGGTP